MPYEKAGNDNSVTLCSYRPSMTESKPNPATTMINPGLSRAAVEVSKVRLSYGRGKSAKTILSSIDLTVPDAAM